MGTELNVPLVDQLDGQGRTQQSGNAICLHVMSEAGSASLCPTEENGTDPAREDRPAETTATILVGISEGAGAPSKPSLQPKSNTRKSFRKGRKSRLEHNSSSCVPRSSCFQDYLIQVHHPYPRTDQKMIQQLV
ncbi:unnamed protein product [Caretta caretta]